jgi:hypothetical protein
MAEPFDGGEAAKRKMALRHQLSYREGGRVKRPKKERRDGD